MKKIPSAALLAVFATATITGCKNDDKKMEVAEESRGINLAYMDTTVSPRDDFFSYVNGKWVDSTEIPADQTSWGSFNELRKSTDASALALLERAAKDGNLDASSDQAKAVFLYQSIMDTVARNQKGIEPLRPYLAKIDSIKNKEDLQRYLTEMHQYGGAGFFGFSVRSDAKDSNANAAYIFPTGLGLPDRDFYVAEDANSRTIKTQYEAHITRMLQYLGDTQEQAAKKAKTILAFETNLARPQMDRVQRRDARLSYNPMSVTQLQNQVKAINWKKYLDEIGAADVDTIIISQPKYMQTLQTTFSGRNVEDWKTYLRWNLFNNASSSLSTEIERASWDFYSKTLQGAQEQRPLKERALATVNGSLGEALGKLYVEENFPPEAKQKAQEMIANIIDAFEVRINNLTWMSDSTKVKAIEKLNTTVVKVGYPDEWKDYSGLTIYSPDNKDGSYFQNMMNVSKWRMKETMDKIGEPVDKTEWFMAPQTVNAYYNPSYNEIVFPAAILQPPFYDYKADAAVNYGGIGAVIGHEISHGFDDSGSRFDSEGNLNNWWTENDLSQFETLGTALADQYSAIEVLDSVYINGKVSLGENIGDLGGVNAAYDGLQLHLKKNSNPGLIDGFTPEQRFFMSWATVWRTKMRDEALRNMLRTAPHSPGMYRAFVPLQNIDAFYKAFEIKEGDKMYVAPENRVRIW